MQRPRQIEPQLLPKAHCLWRDHQPAQGSQVRKNRQPENELIASLARFMPKNLLGHQRTGPATTQFEKVKRILRSALPAALCSPLIEPVHQEQIGRASCRERVWN